MPLGPFKVEYFIPSSDVPQRQGFKKKARLLNPPKMHMIAVAGVSYRQSEVRQAVRDFKAANGAYERRAELVYENNNSHDQLAVAVYFLEYAVGYLPRQLCKEYRDALSRVIPSDLNELPMFCPVIFVGGGPGEHMGFRLALPRSSQAAVARTRKAKTGKKTTAVSYDSKMFERT